MCIPAFFKKNIASYIQRKLEEGWEGQFEDHSNNLGLGGREHTTG